MLEFRLANEPQDPLIEVFQILPDRLRDLSLDQIRRQPVVFGNKEIELGQVFSVSGDPTDMHHVWKGDLSCVGGIGYRLSEGLIRIEGNVGNHVGGRMTHGTIQVAGNVGDYVGAEMTGGLVHVQGDSGNGVGACYDGGQCGIGGGAILINGSAADLVGASMRRGIIAIGGHVKDQCGYSMRAGTIVVFGTAGKNVGLEMKRGTIVLMNGSHIPPAGFVSGGFHTLSMTRMLGKYLTELGFSKPLETKSFHVLHGDQLQGGRGELLIAG